MKTYRYLVEVISSNYVDIEANSADEAHDKIDSLSDAEIIDLISETEFRGDSPNRNEEVSYYELVDVLSE